MRTAIVISSIPIVIAALSVGCGKSDGKPSGPRPAVQSVSEDLIMHPSPEDRCPVCAMTTHDKKLPAAITLTDGRSFYFCGPGCMIRTWLDPKKNLGVDKIALKSAVATEFYTGESVDALTATWVAGSDVVGPMGPMPVPLETAAKADTFKAEHGGHSFALKEMTLEKWRSLRKGTKQPQ